MRKIAIYASILMSSLLFANASNDDLKNFDDKKNLFEHNKVRIKVPHKRKIKINPICVTIEYQQDEKVNKIKHLKAEKTPIPGMESDYYKMINATQNTWNSKNIDIISTIDTIDAINTEEDSLDINNSYCNNNIDPYAIPYVEDSLL